MAALTPENEISNPHSDSVLITTKKIEAKKEATISPRPSKSEPVIWKSSQNKNVILQKAVENREVKQFVDERLAYKIVEELELGR